MPSFGKKTPFSSVHLTPFEVAYGVDANGNSPRAENVEGLGENSRFRVFSRSEIAGRGDSLDIGWLKADDSMDSNDLPAPDVLAGEAMAELTEALRELDELMRSLGANDEAEIQKKMLAEVMGLTVLEGYGD